MNDHEAVVDAVDDLLARLDADDAVAHAEVGGVVREATEVVVTDRGVRSETEVTTTGVWCRVFADGAAAYRFTADLSAEALADVADRAVTGGDLLAQSDPARVDRASTHRGVHEGWADESVRERDPATKRETVRDALAAAETALDRARVTYADERLRHALATTSGSTVRTTLDRASVDCTLDPTGGPKLRRHAGSTRGAAFLDRLPEVLAAADADAAAAVAADEAEAPTGNATVVLSPRAAGQLWHELAAYLHADNALFGFSPWEPGDRLADAPLTVEDGVAAGSFAARAYDAEARPTTPVRLVDRGRVASYLHDTATAAEFEAVPAGNAVPAVGFEQAPRIHHRHLEVAAGDATREELLADADVYVRRFGAPHYRDEFERTQRDGTMPPSSLYARDVADRMGARPEAGRFELPVAEGFAVADGALGGRVEPTLAWRPEALATLDGIGRVRETVTGVASKHKSRLPYAVTAPALRLEATLE